jgi:hypothetical protein
MFEEFRCDVEDGGIVAFYFSTLYARRRYVTFPADDTLGYEELKLLRDVMSMLLHGGRAFGKSTT